jgi:hypothetical protein
MTNSLNRLRDGRSGDETLLARSTLKQIVKVATFLMRSKKRHGDFAATAGLTL